MLNFYFPTFSKVSRGPFTWGFLLKLTVSLVKRIFQKLEEILINLELNT